jgi:serine/threonine protein kinase
VAQGLDFLHNHEKVHHRDVKSENVLIFALGSQHIHVKLCDFGISKRFEDEL